MLRCFPKRETGGHGYLTGIKLVMSNSDMVRAWVLERDRPHNLEGFLGLGRGLTVRGALGARWEEVGALDDAIDDAVGEGHGRSHKVVAI